MYTTIDHYNRLRETRRALAKILIFEAMGTRIPDGYVLSDALERMPGCNLALAVLTPVTPEKNAKRIVFSYTVDARFTAGSSDVNIQGEFAHAHGDVFNGAYWTPDNTFGADGQIRCHAYDKASVAAAVRMVVANACSYAPITNFEWKQCDTDPTGKWHLYNGDRRMGAAWKISPGSRKYGTLMGTMHDSLAEAKRKTEFAAAGAISAEIQEQLTSLDDAAEGLGNVLDAPSL